MVAPSLPPPPPGLPSPPMPAPPPGAGRRGGAWGPRVMVALGIALLVALVVGNDGLGSSVQRDRDASERDAYSFVGETAAGAPYRWDPCSPIRYQVDLAGMPESTLDDVREAVRLTSEASGLAFEFDGLVQGTSPADLVRTMDFVAIGGDGSAVWSPVLITFGSEALLRSLDVTDAAGVAFPVTSRLDADQLVSGLIIVNTDAHLVPGFANAMSIGPVLEHELGHIVGLGHVRAPFELMNPAPVVRRWNVGDLAGLRRLGAGSCQAVPEASSSTAGLVPGRPPS